MTSTPELVQLLAEDGTPLGTAEKSAVHTSDTALHLAFSCHLRNAAGEVLVTRRALSKLTWPGVWTNSFCGHPAPGEDMVAAIQRRAQQELGAEVTAIRVILPEFRYRAVDASGIVENEICPVYEAEIRGDLHPHPTEVAEYRWVAPADLAIAVQSTPWAFSPWLGEQLAQLHP